jgi:myo-inositol-1(or 4)-monophosphatase
VTEGDRPSPSDQRAAPDDLRALAEEVAREAGAQLMEAFAGPAVGVATKSTPTDLVSAADEAAQELIFGRLSAARPDDGFIGEEGGHTEGNSGLRWVVDPLDGTSNFLFGVPQWAVSIAVEDADGAVAGVVFDPPRGEMWSAARGVPALLDGSPVTASRRTDLATALVATGFGYDADVRRAQAAVIAELLPDVRDIRRFGAAALDLAWCAGGRFDAYFERGVKQWDIAAGALLCECAGLAVQPLDPAPPQDGGILVAPPGLLDELLPRV